MPYEALYETSKLHPGELTGVLVAETEMCGTVNFYSAGRKTVPYYKMDIYANNNRTIRLFVKDDDLNVIDLTAATAVLTVKRTKDATAVTFSKTTATPAQGAIGAADEGEAFFYILPADTASLTIGQYVFDVKVTLSSGKKYTVVEGLINLLQPVG